MEDWLKLIYDQRTKSFERQIQIIEVRLQFVNWLFGVSSASLFSAFALVRTSMPEMSSLMVRADIAALIAGGIALFGIIFTYLSKREGNESIGYVLEQLTYLDVEAACFTDENLKKESQYDRVMRFMDDDYLDQKTKERMKELTELGLRKVNEVYWQKWLLGAVFASLLFILISMTLSVCSLL